MSSLVLEESLFDEEWQLQQLYPFEEESRTSLPWSSITKANYVDAMHTFIHNEERARRRELSRLNGRDVSTTLTTRFQLGSSSSTPASTSSGELHVCPSDRGLFARLDLDEEVGEDTRRGRLLLQQCNRVNMHLDVDALNKPNVHFEDVSILCEVVVCTKNSVYVVVPKVAVDKLKLNEGSTYIVSIEFQLNRLWLCELHLAVDCVTSLEPIFPDVDMDRRVPWTPSKQWSEDMERRLNTKQREACIAITAHTSVHLPPILLLGPYGTGKTFTVSQSVMLLLKENLHRTSEMDRNRILICTHSNSAADLYITQYIHPFLSQFNSDKKLRVLRVYYKSRWTASVSDVVKTYCLFNEGNSSFRYPLLNEVLQADLILTTLTTARVLLQLGPPQSFFTHILMDEAGQAMEAEMLLPLCLASKSTRIVLAGDPLQLRAEIYSQSSIHEEEYKSMLERLDDRYPKSCCCRIMLTENYRSHRAIVDFSSECFYQQRLFAATKVETVVEEWYPIAFFTARSAFKYSAGQGSAFQDRSATSFHNALEAHEVCTRILELIPKAWHLIATLTIGVVTAYPEQVHLLRAELRKRGLGRRVVVERVRNIQGKEFDVLFISTVRTRRTCISVDPDQQLSQLERLSIKNDKDDFVDLRQKTLEAKKSESEYDFGFLSNERLLNTALTRAKRHVCVVGDPFALCSTGHCRHIWAKFIQRANDHQSFFGMSYCELRDMLGRVERDKSYALTPYSPEFVSHRFSINKDKKTNQGHNDNNGF